MTKKMSLAVTVFCALGLILSWLDHAEGCQLGNGDESAASTTLQRDAELAAPVRLLADGEPIDIGKLSRIAHAGPWVADVDCDGDRDLLVGDFPGYFWFFENVGTDRQPEYTTRGKLQAGGVDAKTPVY